MTCGPTINKFPAKIVVLLTLCTSLTLLESACGGALFKVKPVVELPPLTGAVKSGSAGGVLVKVAPLLGDEESQELFEANLPLSGVLPLRVELEHESGLPVELKRAKFRLRDGEGKEWKLLSTGQAISRILKANGVYFYNPNSRKQFEQEFQPVLDAMQQGKFFVTTGEILLPAFSVNGKPSGSTISCSRFWK